jgi:hypothetical protein
MLVLLGPGWGESAQVFALLAIAGVAQAVGNVQGWLYISLGRAHRQLVYSLITRPLVIAGFFVGVWWNGMNGLALIYGLTTMALLAPGFAVAIHGTFLRGWTDIVAPLLRPTVLVPFAFAAAWFTVLATSAWLPVFQVIAGGLAGLVPMAIACLIPAYRRDYAMMLDFAKQARRPHAPAADRDLPVNEEAGQLGATEVSAGDLEEMVRADSRQEPAKKGSES